MNGNAIIAVTFLLFAGLYVYIPTLGYIIRQRGTVVAIPTKNKGFVTFFCSSVMSIYCYKVHYF